tara:strand:- start:4477 stop:4791 length:315 start_codon:yes stop_codon:yes gene_type:complete
MNQTTYAAIENEVGRAISREFWCKEVAYRGYPQCPYLEIRSMSGEIFCAGTVTENWGVTVFASEEDSQDGICAGGFDTTVSSQCANAERVATALIAAIVKYATT